MFSAVPHPFLQSVLLFAFSLLAFQNTLVTEILFAIDGNVSVDKSCCYIFSNVTGGIYGNVPVFKKLAISCLFIKSTINERNLIFSKQWLKQFDVFSFDVGINGGYRDTWFFDDILT